jgi:ParB family chromosome partitioning protein
MVQALKSGEDVQSARKRISTNTPLAAHLTEKRDSLTKYLRTKVHMTCTAKGSGKISIAFANEEDLNRILALLEK